LMALEERGLKPGEGREVLVTGASGGVGGMAVAMGSAMGHTIVAATGREESHEYLTSLGAKAIIDRAELTTPGGPLAAARWSGAVDTVGGDVLAGVLRSMAYGAAVAACGNAGGPELHTTILPFILRAVSLIGIDSLPVPLERRREVWSRIVQAISPDVLNKMVQVAALIEMPTLAHEILHGQIRGRVVVDVNA
ncbi:MAG: zinc-binding dehydrogenase, partial [Ktedonobacterales bacterium]